MRVALDGHIEFTSSIRPFARQVRYLEGVRAHTFNEKFLGVRNWLWLEVVRVKFLDQEEGRDSGEDTHPRPATHLRKPDGVGRMHAL
jgi:hypothetical protein